jgi:hypothetical protein
VHGAAVRPEGPGEVLASKQLREQAWAGELQHDRRCVSYMARRPLSKLLSKLSTHLHAGVACLVAAAEVTENIRIFDSSYCFRQQAAQT